MSAKHAYSAGQQCFFKHPSESWVLGEVVAQNTDGTFKVCSGKGPTKVDAVVSADDLAPVVQVFMFFIAVCNLRPGIVVCGVVRCGAMPCGAVQCRVVWCGVPKALLPKGKRPGCLPTGTGKRAGLCVLCARCA